MGARGASAKPSWCPLAPLPEHSALLLPAPATSPGRNLPRRRISRKLNGEDELKAAREQIKSLKKENSDLLDRLHRCEAAAAAAATAAATQAAAGAAAAQSLLEEKHQLEKQVAELKKQVAELKKTLRRRERGQGSSAGSTKDTEVPALHIAAQLAAAEAAPAAAEAPQLAEGVDGEGQGAGAAAAGSDSEGAGAAVGDLSVQLSGVGLG